MVYKAPVDEPVYQSWDKLWKKCEEKNDIKYTEPMYDAFQGYMTGDQGVFDKNMGKLLDVDVDEISKAAKDVIDTVQLFLSDKKKGDPSVPIDDAAGSLVVGAGAFVAAAVVAFL